MNKILKKPADLNRKQASSTEDEILTRVNLVKNAVITIQGFKKMNHKQIIVRKRTVILKVQYPGRIKSNLCPVSDKQWERHDCYKIMKISPETVEHAINNCTVSNKNIWNKCQTIEQRLQLFLSTLSDGNPYTYESIYE